MLTLIAAAAFGKKGRLQRNIFVPSCLCVSPTATYQLAAKL
jgi:hypothetical protein